MDAGWRRVDPDDEAQAQADRREVLGRDRGALQLTAQPAAPAAETLPLIIRGFELIERGDIDGFLALQHPEFVLRPAPTWPEPAEVRGHDNFKQWMRSFAEAFAEVRFDFEGEPRLIGDAVVITGAWVGAGASTEIEVRSESFHAVFRSQNGLVLHSLFYTDEEEALEEATRTTPDA